MASGIGKTHVLRLYKSLLRESQKFANYNFKYYAVRRVKDAFKESKTLTDPALIKKEYAFALENLAMIRRQTAVGDMYKTDKLVIENQR